MNRRDRRAKAKTDGPFTPFTPIIRNGRPLAVIRPAKPELALAIARVAKDHNDGALLDRLPEEVGDYTFRGWACKERLGWVIDAQGRLLEELKPGDSFVTMNDPKS